MPEMCVTKNQLTRFGPHWNFVLPHINIWSSAERRPLKLYLFLIWWAKLDYKNKHTWSICIIPVAEIHLHWIMTMTKTNKWGLPPYSSPRPRFCLVGKAHPSLFSSSLKTNASFFCRGISLQWLRSKISICCIGINCRVMDYSRCVTEKEGKDEHKQMTIIKCSAVGGSAMNSPSLFWGGITFNLEGLSGAKRNPDCWQPVHLMSSTDSVSQQSGSYDVDILFFPVRNIQCAAFPGLMELCITLQ